MYFGSSAGGQVLSSTVLGNRALFGSAMFVADQSVAYVFNSTFADNAATEADGGVLYVSGSSFVRLVQSLLVDNTAQLSAGAAYVQQLGRLETFNCTFLRNRAAT